MGGTEYFIRGSKKEPFVGTDEGPNAVPKATEKGPHAGTNRDRRGPNAGPKRDRRGQKKGPNAGPKGTEKGDRSGPKWSAVIKSITTNIKKKEQMFQKGSQTRVPKIVQ